MLNFSLFYRLIESFPCCVPTCNLVFKTVAEFDMHYNSFHRFVCSQCNKPLASPHLLDLHLSEMHDSFFHMLAGRKPMVSAFFIFIDKNSKAAVEILLSYSVFCMNLLNVSWCFCFCQRLQNAWLEMLNF